MVVVIMGVSGSGKSTLGELLAHELGGRFFEADNYHPADNINKMMAGVPLEDEDRAPWLKKLADNITKWSRQEGVVILACSALKRAYRVRLRGKNGAQVCFIYLHGERELIQQRLAKRKSHFMPASLLDSQFSTLEEPADALYISALLPQKEQLRKLLLFLKKCDSPPDSSV
ncbi:MAG: gluconokinase [Magnetococcales bacterium]|nr:gluconokinase [Magnetococcales bacterium]